ncbi:unnamed protein product [Discula destructiva]
MSTPYEVEHGVKPEPPRQRRQIDMSSFHSLLHELTDDPTSTNAAPGDTPQPQQHTNPHAVPTPNVLRGLLDLLRDQWGTLRPEIFDLDEQDPIREAFESLAGGIDAVQGVSQEYLDMLERVPKKTLKADDACPICAENFLDDQFPLVVQLRCSKVHHRFDLECVAPWLQVKGTCPMCREDQTQHDPRNSKKKAQPVYDDEEDEDEDPDMMYA